MTKYVFGILVANKFGVLTRVSSMFTRRGFNIDTLTVGETQSPEFSRITIIEMVILENSGDCVSGIFKNNHLYDGG